MVTKLRLFTLSSSNRSVLAKIHMVTKPIKLTIYNTSMFCSSKNSYGNKTLFNICSGIPQFCSSKNSYGNKTDCECFIHVQMFCSSKNSYGNKTYCASSYDLIKFCSSKNSYGNKTLIFIRSE